MRQLILLAATLSYLHAGESVTFHPASAMVHIGGVEGILPDAASSYQIEMVGGERQGFQLAVIPTGDQPVKIKSISIFSDTHDGIKCTIYRVLAVQHTAPREDPTFHIPPRRLGWMPDVLMPLDGQPETQEAQAVRPKPGEVPLTYYVDLETPRKGEAFESKYTINLETEGRVVAFEVHIKVAAITIPARLPFRTATSWRPWNFDLDKYYGHKLTLEEKKVFWNFCLDYRLSPCSFYGYDPDPAPSELAELKDRGLNVVCLQKVRQRALNDKDKAQLAPKLKQWREELTKIGMERDAVVLLADEPKPETADFCRTNAQWLKEQFPELKLWAATRPKSPWDEFSDIFDTITIHSTDMYVAHSHDEFALRRWLQVHPNGEYWWFHSVEPYAPYTNLRLDNLPIEARVAGWQSAQYAVDGYEYFGIDDWSENVESNAVPWPKRAEQWKTGLSGAGTLCYPDQKMRPMPSLRLVNLRDGIQDWALLEMLSPRHTRMKQAPMLESVSKDLAHYAADPKVLLEARHALIQALQQPSK